MMRTNIGQKERLYCTSYEFYIHYDLITVKLFKFFIFIATVKFIHHCFVNINIKYQEIIYALWFLFLSAF